MATLTITATHDYRDEFLGLPNIDQLLFQTTGSTTATFFSNQFGGGPLLISNSVQIVGDANENRVVVGLASGATAFSAAGWQFSGWSPNDEVILIGNATSNVITGSTEDNTIVGGGGADTLTGGAKRDFFQYVASSDAVAGETVDGGAGTDAIIVDNGLNINFAGVTFTSIEQLFFSHQAIAGPVTVTLASNQIGAGAITSVFGNFMGADTLIVNAVSNVDLSSVTFTSWNNGGNDHVFINGTTLGEVIQATQMADTITTNGGADNIQAFSGGDTILFHAGSEIVPGLSIDGGAGADQLQLDGGGTFDFAGGVTLSALEWVTFLSTLAATATFRGTQVGTGAITQVFGSSGINNLVVNAASDVNLSGLTFTSWTNGTDTVTINGTSSGENLIGSSQDDIINAGGGADTMRGGGGNDTIDGGVGIDTASYAGATQAVVVDLPGHIALGAQIGTDTLNNIENVTTGSGNDAVAGDGATNVVDGGAGIDTVSYYAVSSGVVLDLAGQTGVDGTSTDTLLNFENANGSGFADAISGTAAANVLNGLGGDDTISYYLASQAVIIDLAGNVAVENGIVDTLLNFENANGSAFNDAISGNSGANVLNGLDGIDTLSYYASPQGLVIDLAFTVVVEGGVTDTVLNFENANATSFNDAVAGNAAANVLNGLDGIDTISYYAATQGVIVSLATGIGTLGGVTDTLVNFENVNGSNQFDTITGNGLANVLNGLGGADTLTGGGDNDVFILAAGQSIAELITDFAGNGAAAGDVLRFTGFGTAAQGATFTQFNATQWQIHSGLDGHNEFITLSNGASVHPSDFVFV
jgi:Ca2+-binding RTX toxin-like protein